VDYQYPLEEIRDRIRPELHRTGYSLAGTTALEHFTAITLLSVF
jgi:hypothetical protein